MLNLRVIIYLWVILPSKKSIIKVSLPSQRLTTYHFMDNENENQDVVEETLPEEETTEELPETQEEAPQESEDDSVSISKHEFNKLKRKAIAYDSGKQTAKPKEEVIDRDERFERLELRADGYSKDEIDEIMALGGTKVLNTRIVQSAINYMRQDKKSKDAKEPLSSKSPVYKKFTQDDLAKMSSKEMEKILQE